MENKINHTPQKKLLAIILAALLVVSMALAGCGSSPKPADTSSTTTKNPAMANVVAGDGETLTVGTDATFAPMESLDASNNFVGFDIAFMNAVTQKMGVKIKFVNIPWDTLLAAVQTGDGQCDCAASAMTILPERQKNMLFSDPYFVSVQALAVPQGSSIKSIDDLKSGDKVAVQNGTTGHDYAKNNLAKKGIVVKPYQGGQDCFVAMAAGEVNAVVIDGPVAGNYTKQANYKALNLGAIQGADTENFGISFPKSSTQLCDAVNAAIKQVIDDGTYTQIYKQYIDDKNPPVMPQ
ncbi:MAG: basic amino acid ABC transporter substrate-binding protein [Coriobacteriia bacterium]|nr:basic amino acid ABC transporter substrate-binding protein [Coriobacteriia bacterium]